MDFGSFAIPIYKILYGSGRVTAGPRNTAEEERIPGAGVEGDEGRAGLGHAETPSMESCSAREVSAVAEGVQARSVFWRFGILGFARRRVDFSLRSPFGPPSGAGFLGSHLCERLLERGDDVWIFRIC